MQNYISIVDLIFNIKREKHCKKVDIDLILERCEEKQDDVRKCIDDLVRVGILNSEFDKKRTRTLISTTDVDVKTVINEMNAEETEFRRESNQRKVIMDENKWTDDVMDFSERDKFDVIEKDAFPCFTSDGDEYVTKNDLRRHTNEILLKLDAVKKDISFESYLTFDKYEKFQKNLLESTLRNLHTEIQAKRDELNTLRERTMRETAPDTPRTAYASPPTKTPTAQDTPDIPSRQACNNPEFYRPSYIPPITDIPQTPEFLRNESSTPITRPPTAPKKRPSICISERHVTNNRTSFSAAPPTTTRHSTTPTRTAPGNSSYASITNKGQKTVILTDSHGSRIKGKELSKWIENGIVYVRAFPGSTATDMISYTTPSITNDKPDKVILHVGCNDISKGERDARKIANDIFEVARFCRRGGVNNVYISGILVMNNFNLNSVARKVNYILSTEGALENFIYIDNTRITIDMLYDRIHFNDVGRNLLANNFINSINGNFLY